MFRADHHGDTWMSTNPSKAAIRKAMKGTLDGRYAVDLRKQREGTNDG